MRFTNRSCPKYNGTAEQGDPHYWGVRLLSHEGKMNVLYSTDGNGYWIRREWSDQCDESIFMASRCQGVKGHKGEHWCYQPNGNYAWDDNENDPKHGGCSGSTPPDHKHYIAPIDKQDDLWLASFKDTEVTDPEIIARLENNDPPEGEDASIDRPVTDPQELAKLETFRINFDPDIPKETRDAFVKSLKDELNPKMKRTNITIEFDETVSEEKAKAFLKEFQKEIEKVGGTLEIEE